jgi:hypothetical protein
VVENAKKSLTLPPVMIVVEKSVRDLPCDRCPFRRQVNVMSPKLANLSLGRAPSLLAMSGQIASLNNEQRIREITER